MTDNSRPAEIQKIEEDIRRLEELKQSGFMPADLANSQIDDQREKLKTYQAELKGGGASAQGQISNVDDAAIATNGRIGVGKMK